MKKSLYLCLILIAINCTNVCYSQDFNNNPAWFYVVDTLEIKNPVLVSFYNQGKYKRSNSIMISGDSLIKLNKKSTFQNTITQFGYIYITPYQLKRFIMPYFHDSTENNFMNSSIENIYYALDSNNKNKNDIDSISYLDKDISYSKIYTEQFILILFNYNFINGFPIENIKMNGVPNSYVKVVCPINKD